MDLQVLYFGHFFQRLYLRYILNRIFWALQDSKRSRRVALFKIDILLPFLLLFSTFLLRNERRIHVRHGGLFTLQASIRRAQHGGQWPLIWRRRTTSRGYKERQDSPGFRPAPRASCRPIPPLYLIPRPSRPTSPVSVSSNTIDVGTARCSRNVRVRTLRLNPR